MKNKAVCRGLCTGLFAMGIHSYVLAAPIITTDRSPDAIDNTIDEFFFISDVSNSDLLQAAGVIATTSGWNLTPEGLTDGANGGDGTVDIGSALVGAAWAGDGNSTLATYELGLGSEGLGFDIQEIQTISGWTDVGFGNQSYTVSVRFVGDTLFTELANVDYQPFPNGAGGAGDGGAAKVNITDTTGTLASGVDAIRFSLADTLSANDGGTVFREFDVFGTATAVPEPSSLALIALGGMTLVRRRRNRNSK